MTAMRILVSGLLGLALAAVGDSPASQQKPDAKKRPAVRPGEVNTPPARGERYPDTLKVGDAAPDFTLADPAGKHKTTLSEFRGQKPVVLIFGSFT